MSMRGREKMTPTPWTLHLHHECLGDDVAHISGPHGCAFVMVHSGAENINPGREHIVTREEAQTNAAFIVRAVNSNAALVKALREARGQWKVLRSACAMSSSPSTSAIIGQADAALAAIDAALKEAGGRE